MSAIPVKLLLLAPTWCCEQGDLASCESGVMRAYMDMDGSCAHPCKHHHLQTCGLVLSAGGSRCCQEDPMTLSIQTVVSLMLQIEHSLNPPVINLFLYLCKGHIFM